MEILKFWDRSSNQVPMNLQIFDENFDIYQNFDFLTQNFDFLTQNLIQNLHNFLFGFAQKIRFLIKIQFGNFYS